MDVEELELLLRQQEPEKIKLDLKRELYVIDHPNPKVRDMHWDEFIKDILSLANGNVGTAQERGYLIIGVEDELNSQGTRDIFDVGEVNLQTQRILQKANSACSPPLPDLEIEVVRLSGKRILIISIPPTPYLHETTRVLKTPHTIYQENTVFIRRKEGIGPASTTERQAILAEKQLAFSKAVGFKRVHDFPPNLIQRHREKLSTKRRYARWAEESRDESFIGSAGVHLPLFASPYEDTRGSSEELLPCIHSYRRLLILGEPGMGKTVALERAMWEFSTSTRDVIPIFIPLIQYDGDLMNNVAIALNETGVLNVTSSVEVEQLIVDYTCVFLFDGLNEVAGVFRNKVYVEVASFLRSHPSCPCIITSRSQDELWRRFHSREMIEDAMVVHRITDEQIAKYLVAHLGEKRGRELCDRLNEALQGLARVPLLLWLIKEAGIAGEELPGNRGELFDRFVRQVLKREQKQPDLVTIPLHEKLQALSHLAFHLQQDHRLACSRDEAMRTIQKTKQNIEGEAVVDESVRNGLLIGEKRLHFMHQAVHEYFVALRLENILASFRESRGGVFVQLKTYSSSTSFKKQLRKRAKESWWAEVIVQLAGITEQPMLVARQVLRSNPWLAYWCSIEGRPLGPKMQSQIERQTVARLESPKVEERLRVISELARMENPRTVDYLIIALDDPAISVSELASQTLVRLGEPSVEPLLELLTSTSEAARRAAAKTLGEIWRFEEISQLGSEDTAVRCRAAEVLGNLGDSRAVLPLVSALEDSNGQVRIKAAQSLGHLGDHRATESLMRALERTYAQPRSYESAVIARALASLGRPTDEPLLAGLKDSDSAVRQRALIALGRTWMLPPVAELASDNPDTRKEAAGELGESLDQRVAEPLLAALKDQNQLVRWEATKALGRVWHFLPLVRLGDEEAKIRRTAAREIGKIGDTRAIEPLMAALRDQDSVVRKYAAEALGELGEPAIAPLVSLLSYKDREIRRSVGRALAEIRGQKIIEILGSAIQDHRWWVRETVAECLVRMGDRAVPVLETALQSNEPEVCKLARVALRRIGTVKSQAALRFGGTPSAAPPVEGSNNR